MAVLPTSRPDVSQALAVDPASGLAAGHFRASANALVIECAIPGGSVAVHGREDSRARDG
jgi:hypothetical protein